MYMYVLMLKPAWPVSRFFRPSGLTLDDTVAIGEATKQALRALLCRSHKAEETEEGRYLTNPNELVRILRPFAGHRLQPARWKWARKIAQKITIPVILVVV
jgi:hypothetical protein